MLRKSHTENGEKKMTYCSSLTNRQLVNVLNDEKNRMKRFPVNDGVYLAAKGIYHEAREECLRRGIEPDEALRDDPDDELRNN